MPSAVGSYSPNEDLSTTIVQVRERGERRNCLEETCCVVAPGGKGGEWDTRVGAET